MSRMSKKSENKFQLSRGVIFIALVCLIAYIPAVRSGFVWDDDAMLTENTILRENGLYHSWFSPVQNNYWPMTWTSYWLEHKLWGLKPAGYHITNILIHAACTLLIWRILVQLNIPAAFAAALVFAVHPVNVESVAWIAQRKTILAMMFFLLSLFFYLRFDQTGKKTFHVLSVILFILAMLSKGSVVGLPVVILLCVWWLKGTISKKDIIRSMPFFAVSVAMSVVEVWFQYNRAIGEDVVRSDSFFSRLAGAGWAVWFYLYKAVLPVNLTFIYPRWKIDPASWVSYIPGLLLLVLLTLVWRYRHSWGRPVFFALSFYVVMLLPVLGFFNIYFMRYSLVADHYQYVSIISAVALVAGAVYRYLGAGILRILVALALVVLGGGSWFRCTVYKNAETLWADTLTKIPDSVIANSGLGFALQSQGRFDEAISHYRQVLQVEPDDYASYNNIGGALLAQGNFNKAVGYFQEAIRIKPDHADAYTNLGLAAALQKRTDEAIGYFQRALQVKPNDSQAHYNLGIALLSQGKLDDAISQLRLSIQNKPSNTDAYYKLGAALKTQGKLNEAVIAFRQALQLRPDWILPLNDIALILAVHPDPNMRDAGQSIIFAERAAKLTQYRNPAVLATLAAVYAAAGRYDDAISAAEVALPLTLAQGDEQLANRIRSQLELYKKARP